MQQETTRTDISVSVRVHAFTVLLSPTPRGARLARRLTGAQLASWGLPYEEAEQVVAELAANATVHGRVPGRDFRLALAVTRAAGGEAARAVLRVEVSDARGDRLPPADPTRAAPGDGAESGRGLLLVAALADRWGAEPGPQPRKTVWAEFDLPASLLPGGRRRPEGG